MYRVLIFLILMGMPALLWGQQAGAPALPDDQQGRCKYGVEHMIAFAEQGLTDPASRPERIEKRRKLIENWKTRLEQGEDPCLIYMDIQKAATTF